MENNRGGDYAPGATSTKSHEPRVRYRGLFGAALWGACLLLVGTAAGLFLLVLATREGLADVDRLSRARLETEVLLSELKDLETARRDYSITGDPVFMASYDDVRRRAPVTLDRIIAEAATVDPSVAFDALHVLTQQVLALSDTTIGMARSGRLDDARNSAVQDEGKRVMDAIRGIIAQTNRHIDQRRVAIESMLRIRATWASLLALASAIAASLLVGVGTSILRRQSAGRLRFSEEGHSLAVDAAALGTWEWNWRTDAVVASSVTRLLFRLPEQGALSSRDMFAAIRPEDREGAEGTLRGAAHFETCIWEGRLGNPGEPVRWVHLTAKLYSESGQPAILRGVARDVTDGREAALRMREVEVELWHASRVSTVGEAASATTHELGQPLSAATLFFESCDALLRSEHTLSQAQQLGDLREGIRSGLDALKRASSIVRNLHRFLRKEALRRENVDLNAAVLDAVRLGAVGFERRTEGRIIYNMATDLPAVPGDRTQIQQVVVNLVRNAVEAMVSGERRELRVSTGSHTEGVWLSVSDTGPGLPPEIAAEPFRPFATTKPTGLGLGLSICRSIVQAHDGRIDVTSGPDGTTFSVQLPSAMEPRYADAG